jgi:hypothetical protein
MWLIRSLCVWSIQTDPYLRNCIIIAEKMEHHHHVCQPMEFLICRYYCRCCGSQVITEDEDGQKNIIKTPNWFTCDICKKQFSTSSGRTRHINSIHSSPQFACPKCNKLCSRLDNLNTHIRACRQ